MWALAEPFLDPGSRTFWGWWISFALVALLVGGRQGLLTTARAVGHRSSWLDLQLLIARQLLRALGLLPTAAATLGLAASVSVALHALGTPVVTLPPLLGTALFSLTLFVAWDLSRYLLHRLMHEVPALWAFHQVHHSAEVLTPLTFHRVHPLESALYTLRGVVVTGVITGAFHWALGGVTQWTLLGVAGLGLLLNALFGNLRHSHVHLGFGVLERWLLSPAQHQLHHARDQVGTNYGTWLAVWDRWGGSWRSAGRPVQAFGLTNANHSHDLLSAWLGPIRDAVSPGTRPSTTPSPPTPDAATSRSRS